MVDNQKYAALRHSIVSKESSAPGKSKTRDLHLETQSNLKQSETWDP
jgi:hypothetical protein